MKFTLILQLIVCFVLISLILLQQRGTALGAGFGGEGGFYAKKRGIEKKIFIATIFFSVCFLTLSLLNLLL